jgi:hypothetical protein
MAGHDRSEGAPVTTLRTTIVNHVAVDIDAPPDAVWAAIVEDYVEAKKFGESYVMTPLDDPAALLGGWHMRMEKVGAVIDERVMHYTERDDGAHRLSISADYVSVPNGMQVYATYQAHAAPGGARYTVDCHTNLDIMALAPGREPAQSVPEMKVHFETALMQFLEGVKSRLEKTC